MSTVAEALRAAAAAGIDRFDAQCLLGHVLDRPRSWLFAHDDHLLSADERARFGSLSTRRAAGEPVAYLLGEKEFHGLTLEVSPAVLVPRPDTETLVEWALDLLARRDGEAPAEVLDLGTGSGAIALAIRRGATGAARVVATDLSPAALAVARRNAANLRLDVEFIEGPWWQPLAGRRFTLVVSNPPYIAGDDPHLAALTHEPRLALTPEGDGLQAIRDIVAGAPEHLAPGGWLLFEHGHDQADAVAALLQDHGFIDVSTRHDLAGHGRCTGGRRP
ncbi:peptide chain release factor N(5)-glutamine methyltransferase [Rhizobacter sp. LjRoot28]|uniref:peptide chain release factor N(5)-glutamine methyltransferase n=1 Tax=Rhizobacter sp. LjRoot28 TaxID=3342309 RepID=UPI003ECFC634